MTEPLWKEKFLDLANGVQAVTLVLWVGPFGSSKYTDSVSSTFELMVEMYVFYLYTSLSYITTKEDSSNWGQLHTGKNYWDR